MALFILRLEDRILFDAAAAAVIVQAVGADQGGDAEAANQGQSSESQQNTQGTDNSTQGTDDSSHTSQSDPHTDNASNPPLAEAVSSPQTAPVTLLLVASSIDNPQQMADAAGEGVISVVYDYNATLNQLQQKISDALDGQKADNIIFATEGQTGFIFLLDNVYVTADNLAQDADMAAFWKNVGSMLNENGRVDLLGCFIAGAEQNDFGLLSALDTLVDSNGDNHSIAASYDQTGNSSPSDNWVLEVGNIDAMTYFNKDALSLWTGRLTNFAVTNLNDSGAGSLRQAIIASEANSNNDDIYFNNTNAGITITPNAASVINLLTPLFLTPDTGTGNHTLTIHGDQAINLSNNNVTALTGYAFGTANMIKLAPAGGFSGSELINITASATVTIRGLNLLPGSGLTGILGQGTGAVVIDDVVIGGGSRAIDMISANLTLSDSRIGTDPGGTVVQSYSSGDGILIRAVNANNTFSITNNILSAGGGAIYALDIQAGRGTISGNTFRGNNVGLGMIYLTSGQGSTNNRILNNIFNNNNTGINIAQAGGSSLSDANYLSQNIFFNNGNSAITYSGAVNEGEFPGVIQSSSWSANNVTVSGIWNWPAANSPQSYTVEFFLTKSTTTGAAPQAEFFLGTRTFTTGNNWSAVLSTTNIVGAGAIPEGNYILSATYTANIAVGTHQDTSILAGGAGSNFTVNTGPPVLLTNTGSTAPRGGIDAIITSELSYSDGQTVTYNITTNPIHGFIAFATSPNTPISTFTQTQINNGSVVYRNNGNPALTDSFQFTVTDGTFSTGVTTFNINVIPNSPPTDVGTDTITIGEGNFAAIFPSWTDAESGPSTLTYTIVSGPTTGSLQWGGGPLTQQMINSGQLFYFDTIGSEVPVTFVYNVNDGLNTGANTTFTINFINTNDEPQGADQTRTINVNTQYVFIANDWGFFDPDAGSFQSGQL